jgi:hypothetical protein
MKKKFTRTTGYFFPSGIRFGFTFILPFALIGLFFIDKISGITIAGILLIAITLKEGITINFQTGKLKKYWSLYWLKFGKWNELKSPEKLSLSKKKIGVRYFSWSNRRFEFSDVLYNVHLHFSDNKKPLLISSQKNQDRAREDAYFISSKLNIRL